MGFSNAIYKYPKYKNTTLSQIRALEDYYSYETNEWAQKNYASAKEYMIAQNNCYNDFVEPTQDQIDFYKPFVHKDEFGYITITDALYDNCSGGIALHEDIEDLFGEIEQLDQTQIIKLLAREVEKLDKYQLVPVNINYSFIDQAADDETENIILRKCDGVEVEYEGGVTRRLYTNCEYDDWGTSLMTTKDYVDEYDSHNQFYAVRALTEILSNVDFDKEVVAYSGGW